MIEFAGEEYEDFPAAYAVLTGDVGLDAAKYRVADANGFRKWDSGKPDPSLIPPGAIMDVARVLSHGADKYGANNWHHCTNRRRYAAAALRHIFAWIGGETSDKESGLPHLAHATTCLLFLAEFPKLAEGQSVQHEDLYSPNDLTPAWPNPDAGPDEVAKEVCDSLEAYPAYHDGHVPTPIQKASSDYLNKHIFCADEVEF